jgi:glucosamine--fructose-6-phosphate aminotransferase (isomerizing)
VTSNLDTFLTQIRSLSSLVLDSVPSMEASTRTALTTPEIYGIRQIILTGSGDSYIAALATAAAWRGWTGLPVTAMVSMEASRYIDHGHAPLSGRNRGLLIVAVSSSGEGARLVEATHRLRSLGAITVALTANPTSRLAKAAEKTVDLSIPRAPPAPGTRSYVAALLGLYLMGIRLAEVLMCMTMDRAGNLRHQLRDLANPLQSLPDECEPVIRKLSDKWNDFRLADVLGSGPGFGSASYAAAKLVEAAGVHATAQDIEEFHHLNYFVDAPDAVPTVIFGPTRSLAARRTNELLATLSDLGRPQLLITDAEGLGPPSSTLTLPAVDEFFGPVLHTVPGALLAAFAAARRGTVHYRGHVGPWRGAQEAGLVRNSFMEIQTR